MATKRGGKTGKEIGSLQTAFDILELVKSREPAGVSELARELDYSKSTVYYYLRTMANHRYLVNDGGEYRLGLRLLDYGGHVLASWNVPSIVEDELDQLAAETGETALFAVEEQGTSSYVYRSSGDANDPHLGAEHHLHATAFGKAILAHLPEARLTEVIERHGLPEVTENTITDVETLRGELEQIREHEVAFDDEEHRRAVRSIAAPIVTGGTEDVYGAVGIIGSTGQLEDPKPTVKAQRFTTKPSNLVKRTAHVIRSKLTELDG